MTIRGGAASPKRWCLFPSFFLASISKCDERCCFLYVLHTAEDFQLCFPTHYHCSWWVGVPTGKEIMPVWRYGKCWTVMWGTQVQIITGKLLEWSRASCIFSPHRVIERTLWDRGIRETSYPVAGLLPCSCVSAFITAMKVWVLIVEHPWECFLYSHHYPYISPLASPLEVCFKGFKNIGSCYTTMIL